MQSESVMAALSVLTVNMLLSLFFPAAVSADLADCGTTKPLLHITAPGRMEALSGSCLQIPCTYDSTDTSYDSNKPIYGVWRKGFWNKNTIFHSDGSVKIYPLNITGDLKKKNCTTLFLDLNTTYSDKYFFRIESKKFKASACADSVQITVKDSAWSPSINISGDVKDLKEKESVSISCSAWTPCPLSPPELTWSLQQDSQRQTETNPDGTFTSKIQENMTLSDTHDGSNITCSVRYPVDGGKRNKTAETNLTLSVSYAPKDTSASISPSGLVSAGSWVELSCSSRAKPPVRTFTWFRNCTGGPVNVSEGHVYNFSVTEGGKFYCVAVNNLGNQTSSVISLKVKNKNLIWMGILA
ncbi:sialic acid-binding Ig-like lectin 14, partial [Austrofundulus limnaeus]|uniref:Sialic acid-binding Ig-like lectin 14 n=1 Tax=Austrofundulus limnaeus TaxID=52670 RepID=A0A2I4CPU5_AUSLI